MRAVALLLDAEDVRGAAVGGEQVGAVLGAEQGGERVGAGEEAHEVVVGAGSEHGGEHVVARAFRAELDAEAIGEKIRSV